MGAFGGLVLTNKGIALQMKAQAGAELRYTRVAIGDGVLGSQPIADLTSLISEKISLDITKLRVLGQGRAVIGAVLTNRDLTSGFYFREIGIFAVDPDDGEILYAYANAGSNAEYIPPGGGPDVVEKHIDSVVVVGQAPNVTAVIDQSLVFATLKDMNDHRTAEVLDHPDGSVTAAKLAAGSVTDEKIGDRTISDTSAPSGNSGTLTAILGWLANMIKSITGKSNWRTPPATTLETAKAHMDATTGVHGATSAATPNTIVQRDAQGRIKAAAPAASDDVARKAEVDTKLSLSGGTMTGGIAFDIDEKPASDLPETYPRGFSMMTLSSGDTGGWPCRLGTVLSFIQSVGSGNRLFQLVVEKATNKMWMRNVDSQGTAWQDFVPVWNAGNNGAGSGLDADLLDGRQPSTSASANTIVQRDGNGRFKAAAPAASDDVARKAEVDAAMAAAQAAQNTANAALPASQYSASDILTKLKTVDGAGSGLAADLVPRYSSSGNLQDHVPFAAAHNTGITAGTSTVYYATIDVGNGHQKLRAGFADDADTVDGQHASSFWTKSEIPYETGTWTPELRFELNNSGVTYGTRAGRYTRIGNLVYFTFRLALTSKGSANGDAYITGLPFTSMSGSEHAAFAIGMFNYINMPSNAYWVYGIIFNSSNQIRIRPSGDLDGSISLNASNFRDNTTIRAEGFYFIPN